MNRKRALVIILILFTGLFPLIPIPIAKATEATVSIERSEDDVWMTESGNIFGYESSVRILEPEIGIRSFLRFEDVPLLKSSKITLATLNVYAGFDQGETISPGAKVTIYGIDEPDCAPFSYSGQVWSLERPYTSASVNWDVSDWHYSTWQAVNVTEIVREIINQYAWEQNNSIGFQILGATDSGYEYRTFEDIDHQHHGAHAYLHFHYDVIDEEEEEPPGDPDYGDVEFEEQYGPYMIWRFLGKEILDYVFTEGTEAPYDVMHDTVHPTPATPVSISTTELNLATRINSQQKSVRLSDGTLYAVYSKKLGGFYQIYVKKSVDGGDTWADDTRISTYTDMEDYDQHRPSIAIDGNDTLHVFWWGRGAGFTPNQVWYNKYNTSWVGPTRISTHTNMENKTQQFPVIAVDSNNYLHVCWMGAGGVYDDSQIWYRKYTTSWGTITRISTYAGMNIATQSVPSIAIDGNNSLHVVWVGTATGFTTNPQAWYSKYNTSWFGPTRISTYTDMEDYGQSNVAISADFINFSIHVVWYGKALGYTALNQVWYAKYDTSWIAPIRIGDTVGMEDYSQSDPSIGVDIDDYVHVLWYGKGAGYPDFDVIWYVEYTDSWADPVVLQPIGQNKYPNLRWSRWWSNPSEADDIFIVTDENNTVIETWNGDNFTDLNDLEDWIDDNLLNGGDPLDPTPGTQGWTEEGPFTRFRMRLYFLVIGLGCIFGPIWAMAYKKFDPVGYTWCFLVIVLGVGLLWSITGI